MLSKVPRRRPDPDWGAAKKKVLDRPRDETTGAGESFEWENARRHEYGERMASIMKEIVDFGCDQVKQC